MRDPPAIIVHGLAELRAAMAVGKPFTLLSAPGAASYGGCLWWAALIAAGPFTGPSLLDCGDAPGRAMEALRLGLPGVVLTCEPAVFVPVAGLAETHGARVLSVAPPALDLGQRAAARRLAEWLGARLSDDSGKTLG